MEIRLRLRINAGRHRGSLMKSMGRSMEITKLPDEQSPSKSRRRWRLLVAFLLTLGVLGGGRVWWTERCYKSAMEAIESEIVAGRYAIACKNLNTLLSWKTDTNCGIVYLLGSCELARGRNQAALDAWARVTPGSAFSERAIRGRMRLFHESGQLAAAERLIQDAAQDPRNDRTALMAYLVPSFQEQGRLDEAGRLLEARWEYLNALGEGALEPAIKLVRLHIDLTEKPMPAENIRTVLEKAARRAPEDDRVWLGRANLAIRTAAFDEAERWIDACLRRRPDDIPVWRARLNWAMATNRVDAARQALAQLPGAESPPAEIHRISAWLAAKEGDATTEARELERMVAVDPADSAALDRLGELADHDGRTADSAELRRKKFELGQMRARYQKLNDRKQPIRDAVKMAHLAQQLGRRFESRVFLTLAMAADPGRRDLRHDLERLNATQERSAIPQHTQTLAEALRTSDPTKTGPF